PKQVPREEAEEAFKGVKLGEEPPRTGIDKQKLSALDNDNPLERSPLVDNAKEKLTVKQVGEMFREEEGGQPYRLVAAFDEKGALVDVRGEIFSDKGQWVQRGKDSADKGGIAEMASLRQSRAEAGAAMRQGEKRAIVDAHNASNQGFDEFHVVFG